MSRARNSSSAHSWFRWQWQSEPSLTTQLLNDIPPEIELSDYRRLPSSGSESPSGLLHGEGRKAEAIADLDLFFGMVYYYYCEKGLWCIVTNWIVELLSVIFVVCFIGFVLLGINWPVLLTTKCGLEAVELGQEACDLLQAINPHPLEPFTLTTGIIVGSMVLIAIYGLFNFMKFFVQIKNILRIRHFYYNSLNVTDREIQTTPWPDILEKIVQLQKSQQLCVVKELSAHDIVMRIMRKENYLIGMLNKGLLAFPIPSWVPGACPTIISKENMKKTHLILPKTLEWTLNWCLLESMFDSKFCVQSEFLSNPSLLRKRLMVIGIGMLVISPCLVIFMLVYLFLKHAVQLYNQPSIAFLRRWSNLSKWIFREFNEVDHLFRHRISNSVPHASDYLKQFPSPLMVIIAKFISFVFGGITALCLIIAILDESLVDAHIMGHKFVFVAAVVAAVAAVSRSAVSDQPLVLDHERAMSLVVQQTHYMPKRWRDKENIHSVRVEFESLFQYTGMMLLEEMASIFITPYLLIVVLPERVDEILRFISDFTVDIEGVGHVCSLSVFDFESHGNKKYASPFGARRERRSSQGKMEKSFLSFQATYPTWEPSAHGQQLLSTLCNFREQRMIEELDQYLPSNRRQPGTRYPSGNLHQNRAFLMSRQDVGSLGMLNPNERPHPYLLDLYYKSQPSGLTEIVSESPPLVNVATFPRNQDVWSPPQNRAQAEFEDDDETWSSLISGRMQSHFEASTSSALLRENLSERPNPARHNWWDRPGPQVSAPQGSFLDPPAYGHNNFSGNSDSHHSDRNMEDQMGVHSNIGNWRDSRMLSRTMYIDDPNRDEGIDLHFSEDPRRDEGIGLHFAEDSTIDDAIDLHFTKGSGRDEGPSHTASDVFGNSLRILPVRILPRSQDPVQ